MTDAQQQKDFADMWKGLPKKLFRNTIVGWVEMAILLLSALVIPPILITRLGKEGYGVWALAGQVTAYLAVLDLGVSSSVGRFVAKYSVVKDSANLARTINSAILLFLASSILVVLASLILRTVFSGYFNFSPTYYSIRKSLILWGGIGVALAFPLRIGMGVLEGFHHFHFIYLFRAIGALLKLTLIALLFGVLRNENLLLLLFVGITATILPNLLMCMYAYKKLLDMPFGFGQVNYSNIKEIWSLSMLTLVGTFGALLFNQGQIIGVGKIVGPESVTIYAIPVMLLTYGRMAVSYMATAFRPLASHMQALDQHEYLRKFNIFGTKVSFIICLFLSVIIIVFGQMFLRLWLFSTQLQNEDFLQISSVLSIMVIGFAFGTPQIVTISMLLGTSRQRIYAVVSLAASILGLFIGVFLMLKTSLGLYGMAVGWTSVMVFKGVIAFPIVACRSFKIKLQDYIYGAYWPPLKAGAILAIAAYGLKTFAGEMTIVMLVLNVLLCLFIYAFAVYFLCLDQSQKEFLQGLVARFKAYFV
ncbi:MAG: oligosaccharide flippase family protein [Deltaproteobacteria bacterium]|nr:oligosaccharide flippase family protein [Deltaproteobacteria bacterium]